MIRELEYGRIEHLLVMPVTPFEIMVGKVWSMDWWCLAGAFALVFVLRAKIIQEAIKKSGRVI